MATQEKEKAGDGGSKATAKAGGGSNKQQQHTGVRQMSIMDFVKKKKEAALAAKVRG